jgi:hypothetical protein
MKPALIPDYDTVYHNCFLSLLACRAQLTGVQSQDVAEIHSQEGAQSTMVDGSEDASLKA